jgi:four helix bundle protein
MLQIFKHLTWLDNESYMRLYAEAEEISKMLSGLIKSLSANSS